MYNHKKILISPFLQISHWKHKVLLKIWVIFYRNFKIILSNYKKVFSGQFSTWWFICCGEIQEELNLLQYLLFILKMKCYHCRLSKWEKSLLTQTGRSQAHLIPMIALNYFSNILGLRKLKTHFLSSLFLLNSCAW